MRAPNNVDYQPFDCRHCPMAFRTAPKAEWHEWQAHGVPVPEPDDTKTVTAYRIQTGSIVIGQLNRNDRWELVDKHENPTQTHFHLRHLGTDKVSIQVIKRYDLTTAKFEIED